MAGPQHIFRAIMGTSSGLSGADICLVSRTYNHTSVVVKGVGTADSRITLNSNGDVTITGSPTAPAADEWHCDNIDAALGALWDVRVTLTAGTSPTVNSGLNTWLALSANRVWGNRRLNVAGTTTSTLTFEFRETGGPGTVLATRTGMVVSATLF